MRLWMAAMLMTAALPLAACDRQASDEDDAPLLPGEEDSPEFAQDFVAED